MVQSLCHTPGQPASLCLFAYDGTPGNWNDATLVDETDLESNGTVTDVGHDIC